MRPILFLSAAVLFTAVQKPVLFDIVCSREGDAVRVVRGASGTLLDVTSRSGIGGATVMRRADQWPARLTLRLHLGGLESLSVSNGALTLRASVKSVGGPVRISYSLRNGDEGPAREKGGPYWAEIKVLGSGDAAVSGLPGRGGFELDVPPALLSDAARALEIAWIDFYRR
jgi:hypothetical protein